MIRLVMQNNLISENDLGQVQQACLEAGAQVQEIRVVPFSEDIPEFTYNRKNLYYGSTTLMYNIYTQLNEPIGLFYDEDKYSIENYIKQWGERMLNDGGMFMTVAEFLDDKGIDPDANIFVRPDADSKSFDGQVGTEYEIHQMFQRMIQYEGGVTENTKIYAGPAYNIVKEWRLFIVGGEIITSSRYRDNFNLSKSRDDAPEGMLKFARECIDIYKPHENFAMDIASTSDGDYYIIECGCLNSVGFYHADINKLFKSIVAWMEKQ